MDLVEESWSGRLSTALWITSAPRSRFTQNQHYAQRPHRTTTIRSCVDLEELWSRVVGPGEFGGRSLWLGFRDADATVLPTLAPFDDFPTVPDRPMLGNLRRIVDELVGTSGIASIVLLICRPGSDAMTVQDRRWAALLHDEVSSRYSDWPIHLATRGRIQAFAPDDLIAAA